MDPRIATDLRAKACELIPLPWDWVEVPQAAA
jgi:hypothetical protein